MTSEHDTDPQPAPAFREHTGYSTLITLAGSGGGFVVALLALLVLPNLLGPAAWGAYNALFEQIALAAVVLEFAAGSILLRYGPLWREREPQRYVALWRNLLFSKLPLALLGLLLVLGWGGASLPVALAAVTTTALLSIASLNVNFLWGLSRHTARALSPLINNLLRVICVAAVFVACGRDGLVWALLLYATLFACGYLVLASVLSNLPRVPWQNHRWQLPVEAYREIGLWMYVGGVGFAAIGRLVIILPEHLHVAEESIGILGLCLRALVPVVMLSNAVSMGMVTLLVRESQATDTILRDRAHAIGWRYQNVLIGGYIGGVLALLLPLLRLVLDAAFQPLLPRVPDLAGLAGVAVVLLAWGQFHAQVSFAAGHVRRICAAAVGGTLVMLVAGMLLIPAWDVMGSAAGLVLAALTYYLLLAPWSLRITGYVSVVARIALAACGFAPLRWWLGGDSVLSLAIIAVGGSCLYGALLFALRVLTPADVRRVRNALPLGSRRD